MSSKQKSKRKKGKPVTSEPTQDEATESVDNSQEGMVEKYERELTWCVEQLQLGLETQNPDSRQAAEATKVLRILVSAKAPMIKKRQVMRNTFGDYRKKMQEQEKKSAAAAKRMKLLPVEDKGYQNSQFFRKSVKKTCSETEGEQDENNSLLLKKTNKDVGNGNESNDITDQDSEVKTNELNRSFKFDFKLDDVSGAELGEKDSQSDRGPEKPNSPQTSVIGNNDTEKDFKYHKSENMFRFNFPCEET